MAPVTMFSHQLSFTIYLGLTLAPSYSITLASSTPQLHHSSHYEVKRSLLEIKYPAFKTFKGSMHSGLIPAISLVDEDGNATENIDDHSSYFFWLFRPDRDDEVDKGNPESFRDDTLLIWLNGGPGCSSMVGAMTENGPVTIPKFGPGIPPLNPSSALDAPLVENPYAWTKKSAMLFVEQPGGIGFSTASSAWTEEEASHRTEDDVAQNFYDFLQNLYEIFGEELREKKLYISGQSYAGFYIPSIARGIYLRNKKVSSASHMINLEGIAIGNGWIDPYIQGGTTIDFAFWHGMIDLRTYRSLHEKWDQCLDGKIIDTSVHPLHPYTTPDECGIAKAVMEASGSSMMYDVTTYDTYPGEFTLLCMGDIGGVVSNFFNDPNVRSALNVQSMIELPQWLECVPGSGRRHLKHEQHRDLIILDEDIPSVLPYIAELVDSAKINVLIYNGDLDLACSPQSTEMALESMEWSGKEKWMSPTTTPWQQWMVKENAAGHTKKLDNLQFLVVYNSGHFVPTNQAINALNMIGRFLDSGSFGDTELPQFATNDFNKVQGPLAPIIIYNKRETLKFSILTGVFGFLLGLFVSMGFRRRLSYHGYNHNQSSIDLPFAKTETTPLKHNV